jgi:hypothetical protein
MELWFWIVFGLQVLLWLFLSLTRKGKIISAIYASTLTFLWALNIYHLLPMGPTTNTQATASFIEYTMRSAVDLALQLAIPAWVGLLAGTAISARSESG